LNHTTSCLLRALALTLALTLTEGAAIDASAQPEAAPPVAALKPRDVSVHGDRRIDPYFWLRERDKPEVMRHLRAEQAYTEAYFEPLSSLRNQLFHEMQARLPQRDESVPVRRGAWWTWQRVNAGLQYPEHLRRAAGDPQAPEQSVLDLNELAEGRKFVAIEGPGYSPDGKRLVYMLDSTGGLDFELRVKDLDAQTELPLRRQHVAGVVWGNDSRTLYYLSQDKAQRAHRLWRHVLGSSAPDQLLYEERDEVFNLELGKTGDQRYITLLSTSKNSNETRVLDADQPNARPRRLLARRAGLEYGTEHHGAHFYLRINDRGANFRLVRMPEAAPSLAQAQELLPQRPGVSLEGLHAFKRHLVLLERERGLQQLRVLELDSGASHLVSFDEPAYSLAIADNDNDAFDTSLLRFRYSALGTPETVIDYDMAARTREVRKVAAVGGGFDAERYRSERIEVRAADGALVPVSLFYRRDLRRDGAQPLLLYGYGSYGMSMDPHFSARRLSLVDRGAIFAIAHVRGGGELGPAWYAAGRMDKKMNSFTDFIAAAEALVARGYTQPQQLIIEGGSAGGLLMGAVTNLRPDLFKAVVAAVPFVDVINTMLDETLPLTTGEFVEWGNPKIKREYRWMRAYSPYDNLKRGAYPAMLLQTSLNDSQVPYWEPAKYVARLRTLKTDANPLLLSINMDAGHAGASGRFDALKEHARGYAFMLQQWGLATP
jgi:oligopeptidase B